MKNQKFSESHIQNTAKDYDMDYEDAKYIMEKYPDTYYDELERFIKERADSTY